MGYLQLQQALEVTQIIQWMASPIGWLLSKTQLLIFLIMSTKLDKLISRTHLERTVYLLYLSFTHSSQEDLGGVSHGVVPKEDCCAVPEGEVEGA